MRPSGTIRTTPARFVSLRFASFRFASSPSNHTPSNHPHPPTPRFVDPTTDGAVQYKELLHAIQNLRAAHRGDGLAPPRAPEARPTTAASTTMAAPPSPPVPVEEAIEAPAKPSAPQVVDKLQRDFPGRERPSRTRVARPREKGTVEKTSGPKKDKERVLIKPPKEDRIMAMYLRGKSKVRRMRTRTPLSRRTPPREEYTFRPRLHKYKPSPSWPTIAGSAAGSPQGTGKPSPSSSRGSPSAPSRDGKGSAGRDRRGEKEQRPRPPDQASSGARQPGGLFLEVETEVEGAGGGGGGGGGAGATSAGERAAREGGAARVGREASASMGSAPLSPDDRTALLLDAGAWGILSEHMARNGIEFDGERPLPPRSSSLNSMLRHATPLSTLLGF